MTLSEKNFNDVGITYESANVYFCFVGSGFGFDSSLSLHAAIDSAARSASAMATFVFMSHFFLGC